jgi:hypothetical protein
MAEYFWYRTAVDNRTGTALSNSTLVRVWFGPTQPPPGSGSFALVIIDANGNGLIDQSEWQAVTGSGAGGNLGGAAALYDFTPPGSGLLYTATPCTAGETGLLDGLTKNFSPVPPDFTIICFAEGTMIATPRGPRAVETLAPGDLVLTQDHGPQPIRAIWSGERAGIGPYTPVVIPAGVLGATRDLRVSQNHRLLVRHPQVDLLFAVPEALVMAKSLAGHGGIRAEPVPAVAYVHLHLDRHEIVTADGVPAETLFPGSYLAAAHPLPDATVFGATPANYAEACRPMLTHAEGRVLASGMLPRTAAADARPPVPAAGDRGHRGRHPTRLRRA